MKIRWKTPHTVLLLLDPTARRGQNRIVLAYDVYAVYEKKNSSQIGLKPNTKHTLSESEEKSNKF